MGCDIQFIESAEHSFSCTIAGVTFSLQTPWKEKIEEEYKKFLGNDGEFRYEVEFREEEFLPKVMGRKIFENPAFSVYEEEQGDYIRVFHEEERKEQPYAIAKIDWHHFKVRITVSKNEKRHFGNVRSDFFYIGLERILLQEERMILHATLVDTIYGGLLFSGPSGVGKSTQAELWYRHVNGLIINGDRPILHKQDGRWYGYGSPYAGSSNYHLNAKSEIQAIIMLKQARECHLRKLTPGEAFKKIYSQITINSWEREYVSKVSRMVIELAYEVPVYELACTPDQEAVEILRKELK